MKRSKKALFWLILIALGCSTKEVYRPVNMYIPLPTQTRQEIENINSKLTIMESVYATDPLLFERWIDKKQIERVTIRWEYWKAFEKKMDLKDKYIEQLEARVNKNNEASKTKQLRKIVRKEESKIITSLGREMRNYPFKTKLKLAWNIITSRKEKSGK